MSSISEDTGAITFLRSICTLWEFAEGIRLLEKDEDLVSVRSHFAAETNAMWNGAVEFFRQNERLIKKVRNDIGGHFGNDAATYAIPNLSEGAPATVETIFKDGRADIRLRFAGDIVSTVFTRHLPGATTEDKVQRFMNQQLMEGYRHAAECVHVLAAEYIWPRLGR